ncbi:FtsX-like permease family protein [Ginsengibacter hankyongi]|uniref:FtsX-like permease family protein n=1 Tax=Ginsengibacter hankyongi TaxID=2607284 RepID=A0A5J5IJL6_9BACT|nr:ABC transporter permease [Ginsengibacter hankyongi]KAA9040961.1 FtsX-like permease family protein [Ginsengibacter hankyongi]
MFKNYFKTTFRNLWKNKGYSFLNIGGLAIGIACAGLIFLWVEDELTFNHYFSNRDNLYKVKDRQTYDGTTFTFDATPGPFAAGIKSEMPGIKNTARTTWGNSVLFSLDDKTIYQQGLYVDSPFLKMFQLQFVKGNATNAFSQLHSIVVSKKMANNFFGTTNVIGKTLKVDNKDEYIISGVIKDLPENVSFKFDWLSPFKIYEDQNQWLQYWGNNGVVTYVETQPNTNVEQINKKLYGYIQTKQKETNAKMSIYPMNRWRMYDSFENGKEIAGRIKYVNLFSLIAWIILIIACINFMNLSTARSEQRAREVGVRKVLGAGKSKLISQFIGESIFTSVLAAILAVGIIYLSLPAFNSLVEKQLSVNVANPYHIGALLLIALICGLVAGSYPAFYLSSFNPVYVLKGIKIKTGGSAGLIRKGLVVLQFSISVVLIISTIIIYQQITHVKDRELGYNKQNLVYMYMQGKMRQHFNVIKNDLQSTGVIENAALSNSQVLQLGSNTGDFTWEGKDPSKQVLITVEGVSPEYTATMGMHLKDGRNFYPDGKTDSSNVIINESLAKILKKKNVLGTIVTQGNTNYTIVGVVKDFVYNNMYASAAPLILFSDTSNCNVLSIRIKAGAQLPAALSKIEAVIKNDNPGYPFDYSFVDQQFDKLFKTETLIGKLASVFSILAIFISCLGLFGLAAYTAEKRIKEIGIRKVLGASVKGLASLLSKEFLLLVAISCLIAFPVALWMMYDWLNGYAYRVKISWTVFALAGVLALLIALLTVSFQAIKAAIANPVKSLRSE